MVQPEMNFTQKTEGALLISLSGDWKVGNALPSADDIGKQIEAGPGVQRVIFDGRGIASWDSTLLTFLIRIRNLCSQQNIAFEEAGLPSGIQRLLALASAVPERKGARREEKRATFLEHLGDSAIAFWRSILEMLVFIGEASVAFMRLLSGKARFRRSDLFLTIQECGAQALPIVSLISILVGLILAFIGAIQLKIFGAQIYVASLVADETRH